MSDPETDPVDDQSGLLPPAPPASQTVSGRAQTDDELAQRREQRGEQNLQRVHVATLRKRQRGRIAAAIRADQLAPEALLRGEHPQLEEVIAGWRLERMLKAVPGVGPKRMFDICLMARLNPATPIGRLTTVQRENVADILAIALRRPPRVIGRE